MCKTLLKCLSFFTPLYVVAYPSMSCQNTVLNDHLTLYVNDSKTSIWQGGMKVAKEEILVVASKVKVYIKSKQLLRIFEL